MKMHHKTPKRKGRTDKYKSLIIVKNTIHKLTHITSTEII